MEAGGRSTGHVIELLALTCMILVGTAERFSNGLVTVSTRIQVYWVDISGKHVHVFRVLVKSPWEFFSHKKNCISLVTYPHTLY